MRMPGANATTRRTTRTLINASLTVSLATPKRELSVRPTPQYHPENVLRTIVYKSVNTRYCWPPRYHFVRLQYNCIPTTLDFQTNSLAIACGSHPSGKLNNSGDRQSRVYNQGTVSQTGSHGVVKRTSGTISTSLVVRDRVVGSKENTDNEHGVILFSGTAGTLIAMLKRSVSSGLLKYACLVFNSVR